MRKYTDYKELLDKEKPELVAIATESGKHAAIALDCIAAGCNVIIEKPIALSIADANAIIEAGKRAGVVVCANHQNRFNKSVQYIRKALEDGRFGRLSHGAAHVRWNRGKGYYEQAPWRGTWAQDGGCLMNQCIHNIDLLRWMMGDDVDEVKETTEGEVAKVMDRFKSILAAGKDVAFVIRKGALTDAPKVEYKNDNTMVREEIIQVGASSR